MSAGRRSGRRAPPTAARRWRSRAIGTGVAALAPLCPGRAPAAPLPTVEALRSEELEVAERLVQDFPQEAAPVVLLGTVHFGHGRFEKAMACWRLAAERDAGRTDVYVGLARICMLQGQDERAAAWLRRALEIDPAEPEARELLARALLNAGRAEEAIAALEAAPAATHRTAESHALLGQAWCQLRQYGAAREHLQSALQADPGDEAVCYLLALACAQLGDAERAAELRDRFREMKARGLEARVGRVPEGEDEAAACGAVAQTRALAGGIYREHGQARPAEGHFRRARALDAGNVACRMELAALWRSEGRHREALEVCEELAALQPDNAGVFFQIAALHAQLGERDATLAALRKASELDPDDEDIRRALRAVLSEGRGDPRAPSSGRAP